MKLTIHTRAVGAVAVSAVLLLLLAWPSRAPAREVKAEEPVAAARVRVDPIDWPPAAAVTERGAERLREERRVFAEELRTLKQWIPDNMRGAQSKQWGPWKTMISESKAIEHVPEMAPEQIEQIIAEMEAGARDTVADNLERFWVAFGKRVPLFGEAYAQYQAGQYDKALDTMDPLTKENVLHAFFTYQYDTLPPYSYCAMLMFEGLCHGLNGTIHEAHVRYLLVFKAKLARTMTFSAAARFRAADLYERTERAHFAIPIYQNLANRYAGLLSDTEILRIHVRYRQLMAEKPYRRAMVLAESVGRAMDWGAVGKVTQRQQEALLANLRTLANDEEKDGRIHAQINWEMMGTEIHSAGLEEGLAPTDLTFATDVAVVGSDDWGQLRPRERQKLVESFMERFSDEYRPMLEAYYRAMAQQETNER